MSTPSRPQNESDQTLDSLPLPEPESDPEGVTLPPKAQRRAGAPDTHPDLAAGTGPKRPIPGYVIEGELGRGGMGVVFKARQTSLNRSVAIKMILAGEYASPEACVRFLGEAETVAGMDHPNIVRVMEFGEQDGFPYFSLEYLSGGSLADRLEGTPLPPMDAAKLAATLARAMHYAHEHNVVHRDLKPANILFTGDGVPKITDFGLAKRVEGESGLTVTGTIMGTPSYMAPEQAGGNGNGPGDRVGPIADVYAIGAILYEMLTGRPPFRAATPYETVMQVIRDEPVEPRQLQPKTPRKLETICLKCLRKSPAQRYASAEELADDLERYLNGEPILAKPASFVERSRSWVRKHPTSAVAAGLSAVAVTALLVGGILYNQQLSEALEVAEVRRAEAESAKARAADGFRKRLDTIDDILINIDGRLQKLPDGAAVRHEFLDELRKLSDQLLADNPNDPNVRRQAARIYSNLGEVRGTKGRTEYARAKELLQRLADEFPTAVQYRMDLTLACSRLARALRAAGDREGASAEYRRAIELQDALRAKFPNDPTYHNRSGYYRWQLGNVREEAGDRAGALTLFREALPIHDRLVTLDARNLDSHSDRVGNRLSLAIALEQDRSSQAPRAMADFVAAARDREAAGGSNKGMDLRKAYQQHAMFLLRRGRHADLAALAESYAEEFAGEKTESYNAACYFGHALSALPKGGADREAVAAAYAARALALMHLSVEEGYTEFAHMEADPDLASLRDRSDFQAFLAKAQERFPDKAITPASRIQSLQSVFTTAAQNRSAPLKTATLAERFCAENAPMPDFDKLAERILDTAEKNPAVPEALDGAVWVIQYAPRYSADADALAGRATEMLERDHVTKPSFAKACRVLGAAPSASAERVLRAAEAKNGEINVKALAALMLATAFKDRADAAQKAGDADATSKLQAAEAELEKIASKYGDIVIDDESLRVTVAGLLLKLRALGVGREARPIAGKDLDGKPMALEDFKGQVVLVNFWANWCGFCRQTFPQNRKLVEKMQGRPFALLGVNCDEDLDAARRAVQRERINWRSWAERAEATRISQDWQVEAYPTAFLLDHRGVIRKKWRGKPDADEVAAAVEQLVREAEANP